ncbi:MAG: aspartate kinase [Candidatus Bathycorpusculaceae bacterium]
MKEGETLGYNNEIRRIVVKLGGRSLAKAERAKQLAKKISLELKNGRQIAVVVSAIGNTTDKLIEYSTKACDGKISPKDMDEVLSMGERTSSRLFTAVLKAQGVHAMFIDPTDDDWPIITDNVFNNANPLQHECIQKIRDRLDPLLNKNIVPVIPGFIGKTMQGEVTTLGRGGSDTTAFLVAKAIEANEVILVTDVNGIMTADPKLFPNAKRIKEIDVNKLMNLCDFGHKFLHRKALKLMDKSFKVKVVSYKDGITDDKKGTIIHGTTRKESILNENRGIALITILIKASSNITEIMPNILQPIIRNRIPVLMLSANADTLTLYVPDNRAQEAAEVLHSELLLTENGQIVSIAVKRGVGWIKISEVELENIQKKIHTLKRMAKKLISVLTMASNVYIFIE